MKKYHDIFHLATVDGLTQEDIKTTKDPNAIYPQQPNHFDLKISMVGGNFSEKNTRFDTIPQKANVVLR